MKTTINNGTTYLEFIGENRYTVLSIFLMKISFFFLLLSNDSCVNSEKAPISSDIKSNRVSIQWANGEGN
jgi:hypothetical protein